MLSSIGNKIAELLKNAEKRAEELINTHRVLFVTLVKELLEKETVSGEEIETLFKKYKEQW